MLKVGIHENLVFEKAAVNEKGTLGITFRPVSLNAGVKQELDEFSEEGVAVEVTSESGNSPLLLFPPKVPTFKKKNGDDLTDEDKVDLVRKDLETLRNQLAMIIGAYRATKDLKFTPYANTGITKDNYKVELLDNDNLFKVYTNYITQFIEYMQPYMNNDAHPVRVKLVRQSKDKHYATIPSRYIADNPFIEPMEVPAASSKLKFSKWEKDNGYDNAEPVSKSEADPIPETTPEDTENVFGAR